MCNIELIRRLEGAAARAWPATFEVAPDDGWLLRSTPGLIRGRSNHALPPCRELGETELGPAIDRVVAFAARHGTATGIQVSPLALHAPLMAELDRRGWSVHTPVFVMAGDRAQALARSPERVLPDAEVTDHASPGWLAAWGRCEPEQDVEAHRRTVFPALAGRASFARLGNDAVAIGVEQDSLLGLFCVAAAPDRRRRGLATEIIGRLLERSRAELVYLQVMADNTGGIALYERLGLAEAYRYRHRIAPPAEPGADPLIS